MGCGCEKKGSGVKYHRRRKAAIMKRGSGRGKKRKRASGISFKGSGIIMTGAGVPAKRARKMVSNGRVHI